jgi:hypothetical protein
MTPTPYRKLKMIPKNLKKPVKNVRWVTDEPQKQQRIQLYKKCPTCILVPPKKGQDKMDSKNYKFPICTKLSKTNNKCQYNCTGLLAASRRARLTKKYPKVLSLTTKLLNNWECTKKAVKASTLKRKPVKKIVKRKKPVKKIVKKKPAKKILKRKKPVKKIVKRKPVKKIVKRKKPVKKIVKRKPIKKIVKRKPAKKIVIRRKKPVKKTTTLRRKN